MNSRSSALTVAAAAACAALGFAWFAPRTQAQGTSGGPESLAANTLRGNLTVEVILDPQTGGASADWAGPIKQVDEVTLLDEWVILRKKQGGTTGTLIVPREKIVYVHVGD